MSLLTSFTRSNAGGDEMTPLLITEIGGAAAAAWPGGNQGIFVKFRVARSRPATGLIIGVGSAPGTGNAKAGLYSSDGTTATQIGMSSSTAVSGTNTKQQIPFTAAQVVGPEIDYYAYLVLNNNTDTVLRLTMASGGFAVGFAVSYVQTNVFTTPPASITVADLIVGGGAATGYTPVLALY